MTKAGKIALGCVLALLLLVGGALFAFWNRPLNNLVTTASLADAAAGTDSILSQAGDAYYEIAGSDDFAALFAFADWQLTRDAPAGDPVLQLRFAESWILAFYEDGTAAAYNGYAARDTRGEAYYLVPAGTAQAVADYLAASGTPHTLGDGAISASTFHV